MAQQLVTNGINITAQAPLVPAIYEWVVAKTDAIGEAYAVGGGFEVWAQVEIAVAARRFCIARRFPPNTVEREAAVFSANNLKADFAITTAGFPRHIVELKIEGSSLNGAAEFATNLSSDITRLIEKRVRPDLAGVPGIAVGISCTAVAAQATQSIFQYQGDAPMRINIPGSTIAFWVFARAMQA